MAYDDVLLDLRYNHGFDTSDKNLVKTVDWFLINQKDDGDIPGDVLAQMMGISRWYWENKWISDKQATWLIIHLLKYEQQIDPMKAYA